MWYTESEEENDFFVGFEQQLTFQARKSNTDNGKPSSEILSLKDKIRNQDKGLCLFGCVPPPQTLEESKLLEIVDSTAQIIKELNPDGIMIYDIQDEPSRNGQERPFPFTQTYEPRLYGKLIQQKLSSRVEPIIYRAMLPNETIKEFENWVQQSYQDYGVRNLVLVGGSSSSRATVLNIKEAASAVSQLKLDICIGGITIPERHRDRCDEQQRLLEKTDNGIEFFTSQVVYNADNAILLLQDYDKHCKDNDRTPARIVFTFAPFGSESTAQFLKWLGVEIPDGTQKRVLSRPNLKSRIEESMQICWENWKRILDASKRLNLSVPLGVSVECVSKSRMELKGAIDLLKALRQEMNDYHGFSRFKL